jgi:hypothetical protein
MLDGQRQRERTPISRSESGITLGKDLLGVQIVAELRQDEVRAQVQTSRDLCLIKTPISRVCALQKSALYLVEMSVDTNQEGDL